MVRPAFLLAIGMSLFACGGPSQPPGEVAEAFWEAVLTADSERARALATEASAAELGEEDITGWDITVTFGESAVEEAGATVATQLLDPAGKASPVDIDTHLVLEGDEWRVDASRTMAAARARVAGGFAAEMRELGELLQRELETGMAALSEEMPEIREQLESLGETAGELRQTLEEQLPVLQAEIEALMEALESAMEKAEGSGEEVQEGG